MKKSNCERTWNQGPPPFPHWWNASYFKNINTWRWWDGQRWSVDVPRNSRLSDAIKSAKTPSAEGVEVYWTDYWPRNARIEREEV